MIVHRRDRSEIPAAIIAPFCPPSFNRNVSPALSSANRVRGMGPCRLACPAGETPALPGIAAGDHSAQARP